MPVNLGKLQDAGFETAGGGFVRKGTRFLEVGGVMHSSRKRACQMRSTN